MILDGRRIYVVDDDDAVRDSLTLLLREHGADVEDFESGETFIAAYVPSVSECLVLDVHLAGMSGFDLVSRLRAARQPLPVILMSGNSGADMQARAHQLGVIALLDKPIGFPRLLEALLEAFAR